MGYNVLSIIIITSTTSSPSPNSTNSCAFQCQVLAEICAACHITQKTSSTGLNWRKNPLKSLHNIFPFCYATYNQKQSMAKLFSEQHRFSPSISSTMYYVKN